MTLSSRNAVIGTIGVSIAFVMELTLVPLLLPEFQKQFELSFREVAWIFNSYGVAVALGVLLGGYFGDAFQTKRVFFVGVLFFASGSLIVSFSGSFESVILGRILQGFGGGIFSPQIPVILTRAAPTRPGRVLIIWGSVAGYVAASAPIIYSGVLESRGWRFVFLLFAVISIAAIFTVLRSSISSSVRPERVSRSSYRRLFGSRYFWLILVYVFCTYGAITYYLFRLPLWLAQGQYPLVSAGLALSTLWISFSLVSTLLRNKVDEHHLRIILVSAPIFIAAGFPLAFVCTDITCLAISSALIGCGLACSNSPSTQLLFRVAPQETSSVAASLDITFARIGGAATIMLIAQDTVGQIVLVISIMCAFAFVCALSIVKSQYGTHQSPVT